jgi:hypothetical protein
MGTTGEMEIIPKMEKADGLVSAYQLLDLSGQRIAAYNLSCTDPGALVPMVFLQFQYPQPLYEKKSEEKPTRTVLPTGTRNDLELAAELSAWDAASDEALTIFEAKLD